MSPAVPIFAITLWTATGTALHYIGKAQTHNRTRNTNTQKTAQMQGEGDAQIPPRA